ncbi:MAG: S8 family peptidase [Bacteroidales bacterium]|nr:S8 family peptidase [Bacteroidales bacterium]
MKRYFLTLALFLSTLFANAQIIDNQLLEEMSRRSDDEQIEVIAVMKARYDRDVLNRKANAFATRAERRDFVVKELKSFAEASQKDLIEYINSSKDMRFGTSLWMSNSIAFSATKDAILMISGRDDIKIMGLDKKQHLVPEVISSSDAMNHVQTREITPNITQVNVDRVWELGYTGTGVVVAVVDSGVNYEHADLADHLWDGGEEFPHHGYDIVNGDDDPMDDKGHGTHVAGIVCGDGTSGTQTGAAPDATLMCVKSIAVDGFGGSVNIAGGMEWAVEHGCDMISMSLGMAGAADTDKIVLRRTCVAVNDAGIVAAVCAGNEGNSFLQMAYPIPNNVRVPASCPPPYLDPDQLANPGELSCVIAVGAVNGNDEAASFTSQGPVTWQGIDEFGDYAYEPGIGLIRPDVCAPGVAIKSLDYENVNGYTNMDGTSQATPLVGGIIALMLQKNPNLMPADICRILEETSVKLTPNKSNITGVGRVDALAAVNAVEPYDAIVENENVTFSIYPNPAKDFITFPETSQISLMNIHGQLMDIRVLNNNQIDVSGLQSGIYLMKIQNKFVKIVVER